STRSLPPRTTGQAWGWPSRRGLSRSMGDFCGIKRKSIAARLSKSCCPACKRMNPRILLVEDDLSTASALKKVLSEEGYDVAVAGRGDDGLAQAKAEPFELVLTDLKLPGLTGLELATQLHAAKPKLPIIMMIGS